MASVNSSRMPDSGKPMVSSDGASYEKPVVIPVSSSDNSSAEMTNLIKRQSWVILIVILLCYVNVVWWLIFSYDEFALPSLLYAVAFSIFWLIKLYDVRTANRSFNVSSLHYVSSSISLLVDVLIIVILFIIWAYSKSCTNIGGVVSCTNSKSFQTNMLLGNLAIFGIKFCLEIYYMVLTGRLKDETSRISRLVRPFQTYPSPPSIFSFSIFSLLSCLNSNQRISHLFSLPSILPTVNSSHVSQTLSLIHI
eukprot:TRINITY_DN5664_c0_g1_i1.p1 TRINITY_DN5664_c0_g1~~TRINITY_DN5664_c0_g1_i1.p1  ORF type:complete len:251 (-),score=8.12 TRINITY_DN5664_c0_g1_i1:62-814(-)